MKKLVLCLLGLFFISSLSFGQVIVTGALTGNGSYTDLTTAFNAINGGSQTLANILVTITGNVTQNSTAVLYANTWTSLTVTVSSAYSVTGAPPAGSPLIDLNGTENVTFDGKNSGGNSLTLNNTRAAATNGTSTIRFTASASYDTIRNCRILGSSVNTNYTGTVTGNIIFTGGNNSYNAIQRCNIGDGLTTPTFLLFSSTTGTSEYNTVSGCNFFNWFNAGNYNSAIELDAGNTSWTIDGNSFYQTATRNITGSVEVNPISIANPSGSNFTISNNYIGGQAAQCGGGAMTYTGNGNMEAISLDAGVSVASNILSNVIKNISFTTTAVVTYQTGISVYDGACNINYNQVGDPALTNSISFSGGNGSILHGISIGMGSGSQDVFNISNNIIGGIDINTPGRTEFRGICLQTLGNISGNTAYNVMNNTIGSLSTANCISNDTQNGLCGIYSTAGSSSVSLPCTISGNTIANLTISSTNTANTNIISGIRSQGNGGLFKYGLYSITGNTLFNLTTASQYAGLNAYGIQHQANAEDGQVISGNLVYSLANTSAVSFVAQISGIYLQLALSANNIVEKNFVHNLSLSTTNRNALIYGIQTAAGRATIRNNFVSLGLTGTGSSLTTGYYIYGIYEQAGQNNILFNSVYIGGTGVTGITNNTAAFYSGISTGTRNYVDNIFQNSRTGGTTGKHYAIYMLNGGTITINYNDYFPMLGYYSGGPITTLANWRLATGQDAGSITANPIFVTPAGNASTVDLHIVNQSSPCKDAGLYLASVIDDYDGDIRHNPPDMGADEFQLNAALTWIGGTVGNPTDWRTPDNWSAHMVPTSSDNVVIPVIANPANYPVISTYNMAKCKNAVIADGAYVTISPGMSLSITGTLTLNGNNCIIINSDASGTGSLLFGSLAGPGTALVEQYLSADCWHYMTPPVSNAISGAFLNDYLRYYFEPLGNWSSYIIPPTIPLDTVMQGYEVWRPSRNISIVAFSGPLYSGPQTIGPVHLTHSPLTGGGWNLIGNPYVCAIDLQSTAITWTNIDKTVYYWNSAGGNYLTYVVPAGAGTGSRYAPPMEGFFIHVNSNSGGTFSLSNSVMALSTQDFYKSVQIRPETFCLVAWSHQNSYYDKTAICFNQRAKEGFDPTLDAYKWTGAATAPQLYSKADAINVSVNSLPWKGAKMMIPLYFSCSVSGSYTLAFDSAANYPQGRNIWLEDKKLNQIVPFSPTQPYLFTYEAGESASRFVLHFRNEHPHEADAPLLVNDLNSSNQSLQVYSYEKTIYIRNDNPGATGDIVVYNILGNKVFQGKLGSSTLNAYPMDLPAGIYIVNVITPDGIVNQKVVIR